MSIASRITELVTAAAAALNARNAPGPSDYQVWLAQGNVGTLTDYRNSVAGRAIYPLNNPGSARWVRICTVQTGGVASGAELNAIVSGLGDYGPRQRANVLLSFAAYGTNLQVARAFVESPGTNWNLLWRRTADLTWEVWSQTAAYQNPWSVTVLEQSGVTMQMDSYTDTQPTGLTQFEMLAPGEILLGAVTFANNVQARDANAAGVNQVFGTWNHAQIDLALYCPQAVAINGTLCTVPANAYPPTDAFIQAAYVINNGWSTCTLYISAADGGVHLLNANVPAGSPIVGGGRYRKKPGY